MLQPIDQTPIDVEAALAGSAYEKEAKALAGQFTRAGITIKGMVHNAPLKLKITFGCDVYEVMRLVMECKSKPAVLKSKGVK